MPQSDKRKKKLVTSNDVALRANVSQATVSRVFNNTGQVKPETVELVMNSVRELGYFPNAIARSLTSNQTNMVAVVSVQFENPFYQTIISKISGMLTAMGKQMIFLHSPFNQPLEHILYQVMEYQVDGIIVLSAALSAKLESDLTRIKIPLVIFNKHLDSRHFFSVCSDNMDAGQLVADYLAGKGYRTFGFMSGARLSQTSEYRYIGFTKRLKEHGFDQCQVIPGDYSYRTGYDALLGIAKGTLPEAIFCANDLMALGAMDAARNKLGLRVPDDIAFVGFDNIEQAGWMSYQLTSLQQPLDDMLSYTHNYLSSKMKENDTSGGYILLKCKLIERESS